MSRSKVLTWSSLAAATILGLVWFRGDINRYIKMKRM
jgi:hypothetical protein